MCLGREWLDSPHVCGLAEEVFAALPWPCVVWRRDGRQAVMVNAAFQREFGTSGERAGPAWLDQHLEPAGDSGEFIFRDTHTRPRRYHVTRQVIDVPPAAFDAVFLMPVLAEAGAADDTPPAPVVCLPPGVALTRRESQVLDGIMCGKLNKVIAGELNISPKTVELHRANLMAKLRVHNAVELARAVLEPGPARPDTPIATGA